MSFSKDVKDELTKLIPNENHCRIAELSALFSFYAKVETEPEIRVSFSRDNASALRKCFTLLNKTYNIRTDGFRTEDEKPKTAVELTSKDCDLERVLKDLSLKAPMDILNKDCCKRAYLRGAFLAAGFVNDPNKGYHFEILSDDLEKTKLLTYLFSLFNIIPKHSVRKKYNVTYVKESESIADVLSVMGAHKCMMELANARIVKDVRNSVNRRNNCDMANISKAVNAASKQIEDILLIDELVGLDALPEGLKEMAEVRMEHPESSFSELGTFLDPQVGKSGVNHRLRKISEYAEDLRNERKTK
ncbi:MAG: DNA-binding protein WhiA [Lachnospiraceae bacterium]|nr:DNA-binding protein WhiA [Lachnospiraceae bacterium]